ncbi:MAG: bifunctional UDP-N-acetylglucosamine diphosphorylase/glucosamine-1-phosphate N-acetyltransferase GlmU [Firmicutes bacterium]|nr:bifunctional UDP-N-acetylglucosamine diphosphorylase/glucosamine-1-phosphate N-acetyltransferase GlmU [Bacillota bacterium]
MSNDFKAVILAAGQGTRMKSKVPKVLHKIIDKPMVDYVIDESIKAGASDICVIVGHQSAMVKAMIGDRVKFGLQTEQLGTGHAVMQAGDFLKGGKAVAVLCGDTPLIRAETLQKLAQKHNSEGNDVTVVSMILDEPFGYGRVIRSGESFDKIVEQKDANDEEKACKEVNTGVYIFDGDKLLDAFDKLTNNNSQGEYYLTDTLEIIKNNGGKVGIMVAEDADEFLGVNSKLQLGEAAQIMKRRINAYHMLNGVTLQDPENTYIGKDVKIGADTLILPGCYIEGNTEIGEDCIIGPNSRITSSKINNCVTVQNSTMIDAFVDNYTTVGPYAYLRPNSKIGEHVRIGDFVEIKNSSIDDGTKVSHLTYVGDSDVGKCVNFGCGTVTVNYDGKNKFRCKIGDNVFIGCNTNLVAPVEVGDHAYTAAGSTITNDVPGDSLAIARSRQENKEGWRVRRNK